MRRLREGRRREGCLKIQELRAGFLGSMSSYPGSRGAPFPGQGLEETPEGAVSGVCGLSGYRACLLKDISADCLHLSPHSRGPQEYYRAADVGADSIGPGGRRVEAPWEGSSGLAGVKTARGFSKPRLSLSTVPTLLPVPLCQHRIVLLVRKAPKLPCLIPSGVISN